MKKFFLLMACAAMMMVGCEKDNNDSDSNNKTNNGGAAPEVNLRDNQASMNGNVIDVQSSVAYQINAQGENRYFVDALCDNPEVSIRLDLYESIVGKTVNLANPQSAGTEISLMVESGDIFLDQEIHPGDGTTEPYIGYNGTVNGTDVQGEGSMFKSGTLKVARTAETGFVLVCSGVLFNDTEIALRVVVSEADIDVWNANK